MDMKHLHSTEKVKTKKNEKKTTQKIHVKKDDEQRKLAFERNDETTNPKKVYLNQTMTEQATSDRTKTCI